MAMRRPSGDGMVRKQKHGRREGHIVIGHKENSDPIFRYIHAYTPKELTAKLGKTSPPIRVWISLRSAGCVSRSDWSRWHQSPLPIGLGSP